MGKKYYVKFDYDLLTGSKWKIYKKRAFCCSTLYETFPCSDKAPEVIQKMYDEFIAPELERLERDN